VGLFSKITEEQMMSAAKRSQQIAEPKKQVNARSIKEQINAMSEKVLEHFKDSKAELITTPEQLHTYIDHMIVCGIGAIDTETTGLSRINDTIVGWSLYFPDDVEVYIPCKHIVPIFDTPYDNQLTYEQCAAELQRLVSANVKLIFANADFDLAMIYKDFKVDLLPVTFFDVILAWRCLKENEQDNSLKGLYSKYVMRGTIDRMKFSDFFTPELFPYCDPQIAKLYAAADAKYTYELFKWQMQYLNKDNPKCKKYKFEAISDLVFSIETPLIKVCQMMHRRGVYLEQSVADMLQKKYNNILKDEAKKLQATLREIMDDPKYATSVRSPFASVEDFNPNSGPHVEWLVYDLLKLDTGTKKRTTSKEILGQFNVPILKNILKYRSLVTLIGTFVDKLPKLAAETPDHKIHCEFKSIGVISAPCIA
jgi:DNA polymerase I-like protein with 3'-5' exonuclease and polymerase domains